MLTKPKSYLLLTAVLAAGVLIGAALGRPMPTRAQEATETTSLLSQTNGLLSSILAELIEIHRNTQPANPNAINTQPAGL